MFYYKRDLDQWVRMTAHLCVTEEGALSRLFDEALVTEKPLSHNVELLCRRLRASTRPERSAMKRMLEEFFTETAEGFVSAWVQAHIHATTDKKKTLAANGSKGGIATANARNPDSKPPANAADPAANGQPLHNFITSGLQDSKTVPLHSVAAAPPPSPPDPSLILRDESWPLLADVQAEAERLMVPPECAQKFWNDHEQVGWRNKHDVPIANWRPGFANYATAWKAHDFRDSAGFGSQKKEGAADSAVPVKPAAWDIAPGDWLKVWELLYDGCAPMCWPDIPDTNRREIWLHAQSLGTEPADDRWRGLMMKECESQESPTDGVADTAWPAFPLEWRHGVIQGLKSLQKKKSAG